MGSSDQRRVSQVERALLDGLLAHDFAGVAALREQARNVLASRGCGCGCGTISLTPRDQDAPRSTSGSPAEVEGHVLGAEGEDIGGVLLFVKDGLLFSVEVYSYGEPLPLPEPPQVIWEKVPRR